MNIIISFYCVSLIFNLSVSCEISEHDNIKEMKENVKKNYEITSKNITHGSNNDNITVTSTKPNLINPKVPLQNVLHLHARPSFNGIPRKTLNVLKSTNIPGKAAKILNAANAPIIVPFAGKKNRNYKPLVFRLNDTNKSIKTHASEDSILNTTTVSQNYSVISNNDTKNTLIVETTTTSENKQTEIDRSRANVVAENNKNKYKNHPKHNCHHNKKENKTTEISTDIDRLRKTEDVFIDTKISKNNLEHEQSKEELDKSNFSNLHVKLTHVDAWNEMYSKPIEIESTASGGTDNNFNNILKNGLSMNTIELGDSSTKFEDSILLKYLTNHNGRDNNDQDLNKNSDIIDNQEKKSGILYSELWPGFGTQPNKRKFNYHKFQPQTNNMMHSYYQHQPCDLCQQRFIGIPIKLNKPLILPCVYEKKGNNKPYFKCDIPDYFDRESKDEQAVYNKELYQNQIIEFDDFNRNNYLDPDLEVNRDPERYYDEVNYWVSCNYN